MSRIGALLPWVNGDPLSLPEIRAALRGFLFVAYRDGVPDGVAVQRDLDCEIRGLTERAAARLRQDVLGMLDAFDPDDSSVAMQRPQPSFWVGLHLTPVRTSGPRPDNLPPRYWKRPTGPGGWLLVGGTIRDVLRFELLRALVAPGALRPIARCPAPRAGGIVCGRWLVGAGGGRGRTRLYCCHACRVRAAQAKTKDNASYRKRRLRGSLGARRKGSRKK